MKNIILSLTLLLCLSLNCLSQKTITIEDVIQKEFGISGAAFTNHVFRRFYFIRRLEHAIKVLDFFSHNRAQKNIYKSKKQELSPLFMVWNDFTSYKDLLDQVLVEDFTKEVFVVSSGLLTGTGHSNQIDTEAIQEFLSSKHSKCIALKETTSINAMTSMPFLQILETIENEQEKKDNSMISRVVDLVPFVTVDEVVYRFYSLQRLKRAVNLVKKLEKKQKLYIPFKSSWENDGLTFNGNHFSNNCITTTIQIICNKKDIQSLLNLWSSLNRYKYVKEPIIITEFTILIINILQNTMQHLFPNDYTQLHSTNKVHSMAVLESMPLEEVLDILDILVDELPNFIEKYELDTEIPWKKWLRKYWLLAPVGAATLGLRLYLTYKGAEIDPVKAPPVGPPSGGVPINYF